MSLEKILCLIILIEGYIVLAVELLAIRQIIPFVGNGIETIAIVVAAVLMPLAIGYYVGGKYKAHQVKKRFITIRAKLINNVKIAAFILALGLSYLTLQIFFPILDLIGISHRVIQTTIYSTLFIAFPVFLLGQTIPLISNYFSRDKLSKIAGKMLFFSTIGSFLGSIISTLILMSFIGVNNTVIITIILMAILVLILSKKIISRDSILILISVIFVILFNSDSAMRSYGVIENNGYSTIKILPQEDGRILSINNSLSSGYSDKIDGRFHYIKYVEDNFINLDKRNKNILIIGAGGFTIGVNDDLNKYVFIDIDKSLKKVAEKFFLQKLLGKNKLFIAESARVFLRHNKEKYDLIFIDTYSNLESIPPDLITQEFFSQIKNSLTEDGVAVFNVITSPNFKDQYSVKLDNTMHLVFNNVNRQVIGDYDGFSRKNRGKNVIYSYFNRGNKLGSYTDDNNSSFLDKGY